MVFKKLNNLYRNAISTMIESSVTEVAFVTTGAESLSECVNFRSEISLNFVQDTTLQELLLYGKCGRSR